jgi:hypothetical protein
MAKVIGKAELCSTNLKYFKALQGIYGKTLFDRYPALANIVNGNIDTIYQDFLSQPVKEDNTITFFGKTFNETPRILSDLHESEKEKYRTIKYETLAHFENKITALKDSGKTTEAEFLADAIKFIDDRFIYCYDDKVVLGVWGMQLRDNVSEDISVFYKNLITKKKKENAKDEKNEKEIIETVSPISTFNISFNAGENGSLNGNSFVTKDAKSFLSGDEIPKVQPKAGYEFAGWSENPGSYSSIEN